VFERGPNAFDNRHPGGHPRAMTTQFTWVDPTLNVDGSAIAAGEITGYTVGVRSTTTTGSVVGVYPMLSPVGPTITSEAFSALTTILKPGAYAGAVQANGPANSAWSAEVAFTIAVPVPNAPSAVKAV
jgi:hypothetical protein